MAQAAEYSLMTFVLAEPASADKASGCKHVAVLPSFCQSPLGDCLQLVD